MKLKINRRKTINIEIDSIEKRIKNLNLSIECKNKEISDLKTKLREQQADNIKNIKNIFKAIDRIDEIRILCEKTNNHELLSVLNASIRMLKNNLRDIGIEEIPTVGELFNSNIHECIQTKSIEGSQKDEILEIVRRGYYHDGKVLRSAMVIISK